MSDSRLTVYGAYISPASRTVLQLLSASGIPYNLHNINILKKEQLTPEYLQINPTHTIPSIVEQQGTDGDESKRNEEPLVLFQSHAILRYLCVRYPKEASKFLPSSPREQAYVDSYLSWNTLNVEWLRNKLIGNADQELTLKLQKSLSIIDTLFLNDRSPWVYGISNVTIADFSLFNELIMIELLKETDIYKYQRIVKFINAMLQTSHGAEMKRKLYETAKDLGFI